MDRQMFLYDLYNQSDSSTGGDESFRLLNWNVRNPSLARAKRQTELVSKGSFDCIVLTELKISDGGLFLSDALRSFGYKIALCEPSDSDYVALLATRGVDQCALSMTTVSKVHRCPGVSFRYRDKEMVIVGAYVPSRGPQERRNVDKREFQNQFAAALRKLCTERRKEHMIVAGDMNVVEPEHHPEYPFFGEWEYDFYKSFRDSGLSDAFRLVNPDQMDHSWFGRFGDGYRFDHIFVSGGLEPFLKTCSYAHEYRTSGLSDHSGMIMELHFG